MVVIDNMVRGRPENLASAMAKGSVRLIDGDIRDRNLMDRLVAASDVVFHQAALRITHCAAEPRLAREVMVDATFDLLAMCAEHKVERVIAASSASVYGMAEVFPTNEKHHPYNDRTLYGAAKLFNEGLLRSFNDMHGLDYVALRYFNVYGPRMDVHGRYTEVLIRWMERIEGDRAAPDLWRRPTNDGFCSRSGCGTRQHPGCEGARERRRFQCRLRDRDEPHRACHCAGKSNGETASGTPVRWRTCR